MGCVSFLWFVFFLLEFLGGFLLFGLLGDGVLVLVFFGVGRGLFLEKNGGREGEDGFLEVSMGRAEKR